jgi:hypothetical protein
MCEGSCTAQLDVAATCEGTCTGTCDGACSLTNAQGDCEGTCEGMCQGSCNTEIAAGASCSGKCEGTCEYTAPDGGCEASAEVSCKAEANATVQCDGKCEGEVTPPEVSVECEASVEAKASASIECTPPTLDISFKWAVGIDGDLDAQAEFKAWLVGFKGHFSAILALSARGSLIGEAAVNLSTTGEAALTAVLDELSGGSDLKASIGAVCALGQMGKAVESLVSASGKLGTSVAAAGEVTASFGG